MGCMVHVFSWLLSPFYFHPPLPAILSTDVIYSFRPVRYIEQTAVPPFTPSSNPTLPRSHEVVTDHGHEVRSASTNAMFLKHRSADLDIGNTASHICHELPTSSAHTS